MVSHLSTGALRASKIPRIHSFTLTHGRLGRRQPFPRLTGQQSYLHSNSNSSRALAYTASRAVSSRSPGQLQPGQTHRSYATASEPELPKDIAVLGGGLTGLTTAYYLTHFHPDANITIYEATDRLGGWIDTDDVKVKDEHGQDATISFERGARVAAPQTETARWDDFVLYDLIHRLALRDASYAVAKDHPSLSKRYIYYPDHLVELPGPRGKTFLSKLLWSLDVGHKLLTEPLFKGIFRAFMHMLQNSPKVKKDQTQRTGEYAIADHKDVSVGEFASSLVGGPDMVNNMVSALMHGIWGGDVWKLSMAEGTFQSFHLKHQHPETGAILTPLKDFDYYSMKDIVARNAGLPQLFDHYGRSGYIGFHNGFGTFTDALAEALKTNPKVTVKTNTSVESIQYEGKIRKAIITTSNTHTHKYDKVVSSLYSGALARLTGDSLPALKESTAVTIQIVNLWYPNPNLTSANPGFGYLIPQSVPAENNPHAALGIIFDSDREAAAGSPESKSTPGTKLTVMLGGHYWDYLEPGLWPNADQAAEMAIDTVQRQLGIPETEPVFTSTKVCRECIPQHLVGHRARMAQAHSELYNAFRGSLAVVGGSYTPPGVLGSLKAARDMALKVAGKGYLMDDSGTEYDMAHVGETGLGRFYGKNEKFRFVPKTALPYRYGNGKDIRGRIV